MTTFEIVEHVAQLLGGSFGVEPKYPADDVISPNLIGRVEVTRFSCRFEGSDENPSRVRTQI
jgi:hypothetical protein